MKRAIVCAAVLAAFLVAPGMVAGAAAATCVQTGYVRDGIDLTAAQIGGPVSGTLDAAGCNIGVYFDATHPGSVSGADIYGANYFGVLDNGQAGLTVEGSSIHDIGETPPNGAQHGVAVYLAFGSGSTGTIKKNDVWNYQKGGIVANGAGTSAQIVGNTVAGLGPVGYIAQNGIQIGFGATGSIVGNTVTGNSYTGTSTSSAGILLAGGPYYGGDYVAGVSITRNTLIENDVGVWLSNVAADGGAPTTPTDNGVVKNAISNDESNNVYQAGISDQGEGDSIVNNTIAGAGYTPVDGDAPYHRFIDADASFTNDARVVNNTFQ